MKSSLSVEQTREMMISVSQKMIDKKDELNRADKAVGDGDHGTAMTRGFEAVIDSIQNEHFDDLASLLKTVGNIILDSVGGAAGIIFGTLFRSGSNALINKIELDTSGYSNFLKNAVEAIKLRGNVKMGDKTVLDALEPAYKATLESSDVSIVKVMERASQAAFQGMEYTKSISAKIGRAKILGDRSIGHPDPGALSVYYILKFMNDYVKGV